MVLFRLSVVLLVSSSLVLLLRADDFSCPVKSITKDNGVTGTIPAGATSMVRVPANTNCTYTFEIPKGFALKVDTLSQYDASPGDSIIYDDFFMSPPMNNLIYAVNKELLIKVYSISGNLTFIANYTYIDMTNYEQVIKPTGAYFNATLEKNKYYTVQAPAGDQVVLKFGEIDNGVYDSTISDVFVFDGNDIFDAKYLGRFSELCKKPDYKVTSTSNTITLLNLYGTPSYSLFLGNDASAVDHMDQYGVYVIESNKDLHGYMDLFNDYSESWNTVICDGCTSFSIESLQFDPRWKAANGYVEIQGMTPTQKLSPFLKYPYSTDNNSSFPQLITSSMATFHIYNTSIELVVRPGTQQAGFAASPGQSTYIYSPQLMDPDVSPKFDYNFSDYSNPSGIYNFSINLQIIELENDGDELDVKVFSEEGLATLNKTYTKTKMNNQFMSGMGHTLNMKYTGSKNSEVILNLKMIDLSNNSSSPTTEGITNGTTITTISTETPATSTDTKYFSTSSAIKTTMTAISTGTPVTSIDTTHFSTSSTVGSRATRIVVEATTKGGAAFIYSSALLMSVISSLIN